jgi:hypothetical protein
MQLYFYSLQNLTEARFAASLYPDFLGFNLSLTQENYISPIELSKILPWLSGSEIIAQFYDEPYAEIALIMQMLELKHVEVPFDYPHVEALRNDYIIHSQNGKADWAVSGRNSLIANAKNDVFVEVDGTTSEILLQIEQNSLDKIAIKGRKESAPGMADVGDWVDLMEALGVL